MGKKNRRLMQKIAAVITAAAIIVPQASIYANPDESDIITDSGAADIIDAPSEDSEAIGDDNTNSGGSINSSEDSSSDNLIDNAVSNDSADDEQDNIVYEDDENSDAIVTADATAEPTATPEPKQTRLINGDFEYPALNDKADKLFKHTKGDWDNCGPWYVKKREDIKKDFDNPSDFESKFGWYTTEKDGKIELVLAKGDDGKYIKFYNPSSDSSEKTKNVFDYYYKRVNNQETEITYGKQFAELCAEDQSSLYQTISTTPGAVLSWGLKHRGRRPDKDQGANSAMSSGKDTMALFIGKSQETALTKPATGVNIIGKEKTSTSKNDIFMWMAELLKNSGKINILTQEDGQVKNNEGVGQDNMKSYTVYSKEDVDAKDVNINNYNQYFSLEYDAEKKITKEWKCWIITDEQAWNSYEGTYDVEAGQTETTFAFTALTGIRTRDKQMINEGNLLDDVTFSASYPLNVSTTASGTGTVKISDDNYTVDKQVDKDNTHNGNYLDGTEVTITATPNNDEGASSCSFIGAYIDGTMYEAGNSKFDYDEDSNTYTFTEIINKPRNIQLIFAKASTVTYDPNGGTFNSTKENTEYKIVAASDEDSADRAENDTKVGYYYNTESAIPDDTKKSKFIGWYFARGNNNNGALITKDHNVTYEKNSGEDDKLKVTYTESDGDSGDAVPNAETKDTYVPATSGVTFVAQYKHLQKAIVVVKDTTDILYKEPSSADTKDYGTVNTTITSTINLTDGIELISDSYGRTSSDWGKDIENTAVMHMKSDESGEYMFMGWYTEANGGEKLSDASIYSYPISGPRTVYARFSKKLQYPYLSFVARDNSKAVQLDKSIPFSKGSHIAVGENIVSTYDGNGEDENVSISEGHYGGSQYGNTISTGFVANINKTNASDLTSRYCTWTITIPADGTYIKKADDSSEIKGVTLGDAVLKDSDGDAEEETNNFYNKGNIYKVEKVNDSKDGELTLKLYDVLPAAVSGEMTITYGIIIDNLYAPGAEAAMTFDKEDGAVDISGGSDAIHSNDFNSYVSGSPYANQNTN